LVAVTGLAREWCSECILALRLLLHAGFSHWSSAELCTQIHNPHWPSWLWLRSTRGQRIFRSTQWRYVPTFSSL